MVAQRLDSPFAERIPQRLDQARMCENPVDFFGRNETHAAPPRLRLSCLSNGWEGSDAARGKMCLCGALAPFVPDLELACRLAILVLLEPGQGAAQDQPERQSEEEKDEERHLHAQR